MASKMKLKSSAQPTRSRSSFPKVPCLQRPTTKFEEYVIRKIRKIPRFVLHLLQLEIGGQIRLWSIFCHSYVDFCIELTTPIYFKRNQKADFKECDDSRQELSIQSQRRRCLRMGIELNNSLQFQSRSSTSRSMSSSSD
jgi:hypothetical protein